MNVQKREIVLLCEPNKNVNHLLILHPFIYLFFFDIEIKFDMKLITF